VRRLLFVCLGNIIRSPLAEHLFLDLVRQAAVAENYAVDSAGTGDWHMGQSPDPRMIETAAKHGLQLGGTARQVRSDDLESFDLVLAMDEDNRASLLELARAPAQRGKIRMLREFDPQQDGLEVPDPWYGGRADFEQTYQIIERSVRGLLEALQRGEA